MRRVFLSGAGALTGRCDKADKELAARVGRGEPAPPSLLEHARTYPDCRRAVEFWAAMPLGLGLLLPEGGSSALQGSAWRGKPGSGQAAGTGKATAAGQSDGSGVGSGGTSAGSGGGLVSGE